MLLNYELYKPKIHVGTILHRMYIIAIHTVMHKQSYHPSIVVESSLTFGIFCISSLRKAKLVVLHMIIGGSAVQSGHLNASS